VDLISGGRSKAIIREPKPGTKIERALTVYSAIRRASYVLLDMNRTTLFLRIDANNLVKNILGHADKYLYDPENDVSRTLQDMEKLLFSEVYANARSCAFKHQYIREQKDRFRNIVKRTGMNLYCRNYKTLTTQLNQAKISTFGKYRVSQLIRHVGRLNLLPDSLFERTECRFYSEQRKLHTDCDANLEFFVTPTPYPESGSIIDVFAKGPLSAIDLSSLCYTLYRYVSECYEGWDEPLSSYAARNPLRELFTQILRLYISYEIAVRFAEGTSPRDYHVDALSRGPARSSWITHFRSDIREADLSRDRKWELSALVQLLSRQRGGMFLVAISNIHLYSPDGTRIAEWDGAFFDLQKEGIVLYIVEAKRGESRRSNKAKGSLLDSLKKLGLERNQRSISVVKCQGYAYAKIGLKDVIKVASVFGAPISLA
jgi:hypothetical protein